MFQAKREVNKKYQISERVCFFSLQLSGLEVTVSENAEELIGLVYKDVQILLVVKYIV